MEDLNYYTVSSFIFWKILHPLFFIFQNFISRLIGHLQDLRVLEYISQPKIEKAALADPKKVAGPAKPQILACDLEPVLSVP